MSFKGLVLGVIIFLLLITIVYADIINSEDPLIGKFCRLHYEIKNIVNLTKAYDNINRVFDLFEFYTFFVRNKFEDYKSGKLSSSEFEKILDQLSNMLRDIKPITDPETLKIYIWPKGKIPSNTVYTENPSCKFWDEPGFQPYLVPYLLDNKIKPKGAVIICPGGGYTWRSDPVEGDPYARFFNSIGYQAFVLNYRVAPYTPIESALDLQRAIRYIRYNAKKYNIDPENIFVIGSSAGGAVCLDVANELYGDILPNKIVKDYVPDEIDKVSADVKGVIGIYTAMGIMRKVDKIENPNYPPTFLVVGNQDFLYKDAISTFQMLLVNKVSVELHIFEGAGHAFGLGIDYLGGRKPIPGVNRWPELAGIWMDKILQRKK